MAKRLSRRPNVASAREKRDERGIIAARRKRDREMKAESKKAVAARSAANKKARPKPEPVVYSYSRGPVDMPKKVQAWLQQEVADQNKRYRKIYKEIDELEPQRNQWAKEFFQRISGPRGFSVDGGTRRTIKKSELPKKPRRYWRVVW